MTEPARLLDVVIGMSEDGPFTEVLATTFTFDSDFFATTGVLPALAGEVQRERTRADGDRRRRIDSNVLRDLLGNPYIGILQGRPSGSGATPGWIDRFLWPTRRFGVLHAKCLLAVGQTRAHVVVTSANLTEGSWCRNIEVAACWSAPLRPVSAEDRARSAAASVIAAGIAQLAAIANAPGMANVATRVSEDLEQAGAAAPQIVWSGGPFAGRPLDALRSASGAKLTVVSPFWASDDHTAAKVLKELHGIGSPVELVGRSLPGSSIIELPDSMATAATTAGATLAVARPPTAENAESLEARLLHGKQFTVGKGAGSRSYVGSANATTQGLALGPRPNIELGVIVESSTVVPSDKARGTRSPIGEDPDDPDSGGLDVDHWGDSYAQASLSASGDLDLVVEPAPSIGAFVEVPTGGETHQLARRQHQTLQLPADERVALTQRSEISLVAPTGVRLAIPVVLADALKLQIDSQPVAGSMGLDELLARLAANPLRHPGDDVLDDGAGGLEDIGDPLSVQPLGAPRTFVHRAREAVEVITAAEPQILEFMARTPPPPDRLVELRLGGTGSIVDLARRTAATSGQPGGLRPIAAAFVVNEIAMLLHRLRPKPPARSAPIENLSREVDVLLSQLLSALQGDPGNVVQQLRKLQDTS